MVEGIEGSGKTTLLASLGARLRAAGLRHVATREPGGTPLGERLRATFTEPGLAIEPIAEALLVSAARAQHVVEVIEPALRAAAWVLCDRFVGATAAYQGAGRGVGGEVLDALAALATGGLVPDLTLLVDLPVALSRARVAARARTAGVAIDRLEREDDAFHERVRAGYLAFAARNPGVVVLDGTLPAPALAEAAWLAVRALRA